MGSAMSKATLDLSWLISGVLVRSRRSYNLELAWSGATRGRVAWKGGKGSPDWDGIRYMEYARTMRGTRGRRCYNKGVPTGNRTIEQVEQISRGLALW